MEIKVVIDESAILDRCITEVLGPVQYDVGEEEPVASFARSMRKKIDARIEREIEVAIRAEIERVLQGKVEPMIDEACAAGFREFDQYGQPKGPPIPFAAFIHKSIAQMFGGERGGYSEPWGHRVAREAFTKHIAAAMEAEAKNLQKAVRAAVDEKLSADVSKILRSALGI